MAHPLRVGLDPAVDRVAETGDRERTFDVGVGPAAAAGLPPELEVPHPGQVRDERGVLDHRADTTPAPARRAAPARSKSRASPAVGWIKPTSIRSAVVLPAPFGPSRPHTWPGRDLEVETGDRLDPPVALGQAANGDYGGFGHPRDLRAHDALHPRARENLAKPRIGLASGR